MNTSLKREGCKRVARPTTSHVEAAMSGKKDEHSMTASRKTGLKITDTGNGYKFDPFEGVNPFSNPSSAEERKVQERTTEAPKSANDFEMLDLCIGNYSREDLYKLFGFRTSIMLDEECMKEARKIVLKTHPDKSRLDNKYFVFFSEAFKRLQDIYDFQNKTSAEKKTVSRLLDEQQIADTDNNRTLDKLFTAHKDLKSDPNKFNEWFNQQFEKHRVDKPAETGYGAWLSSDEDIQFNTQVTTKDGMTAEIEKRKRELRQLVQYEGVGDSMSCSLGGSALMAYDSNFTSGSLFSSDGMGYTDLRQAYVESVIPVTEEDFRKVKQFKSMDELKRHREDASQLKPLSKEEALRKLFRDNQQKDEESAALAFYYAQQSEKTKKSQKDFWSSLKQLE